MKEEIEGDEDEDLVDGNVISEGGFENEQHLFCKIVDKAAWLKGRMRRGTGGGGRQGGWKR